MIPFAIWTPGIWELMVILMIVFVLFGAGKLPQVFKMMGEGLKTFRDAQRDDLPSDPVATTPPKQLDGDRVTEAEEVKERTA